MEEISQEVHKAFEIIQKGGIILYPTDTVWGIGCDATNPEAVAKIYALKKMLENQSMIVLVNSDRMLYTVFKEVPEVAWQLIELSENPTTLVLDNPKNVAQNLISADKSLGIRMVKEPFCYKLLERMKKPLVATSANFFGHPVPKSFKEINSEIKKGVDYIVNLHHEKVTSKPSTMIKLTNDLQVKILRK